MPSTLPSNFPFRFRFSCRRWNSASGTPRSVDPETLDASFRVPIWSLAPWSDESLERRIVEPVESIGVDGENAGIFDFRLGWSLDGLILTVVVSGKDEQPIWQRSALERANSLRLCLDTRDMKDARRGTRFCYKFAFYPLVGESARSARPLAQWLPINRAREIPTGVDVDAFVMASRRKSDGYSFTAFVPGTFLNGYDPGFFDRFGMHFTVSDSPRGVFTLQHAPPIPFEDDPSLWSSFVMTGAKDL